MKKIIFAFFLLVVYAASFSQQTNPSATVTQPDYLKKSLQQKTAAHFMLWCGFAASITGMVISQNSNYKPGFWGGRNDKKYNPTGDVIAVTGLALMVGSIPLFIIAGKNKKRALGLAFKNEQSPLLIKQSIVSRPVSFLSLKIGL